MVENKSVSINFREELNLVTKELKDYNYGKIEIGSESVNYPKKLKKD